MSRITFRTLLALFALALMAAVPAIANAKSGSHQHTRSAKKAKKADRNRDGLPDRWERRHRLSLRVNQSGRDQDRDGANNAAEFTAHTDPRDHDSDDDGVKDGDEASIGTIVSFENGTLVISSGGLPVSGKVTDRTEIECEGDHGDDDHGDDHGDDHEGHSSSRGDDDGDHEVHGDDDHSDGGMPTAGGMPTSGGLPVPPLPSCTISDLKPGALVHEAELKLTQAGPVWDEIELVRPAPMAP